MSTVVTAEDTREESCARDKRKIVLVSRETGTFWCAGWLFTIGFANLGFWKAVLAVVVWPYFLGDLAAAR